MSRVLMVDLASDERGNTGKVVEGLRQRGVEVLHPRHDKEFASMVALGPCTNHSVDVLLHFGLDIPPPEQLRIIEAYELLGTHVINPVAPTRMINTRIGLATFLDRLNIKHPRYYFGYAKKVPKDLGNPVVFKGISGHLVQIVDSSRIHCSSEVAYFEERLSNPSGKTTTIYFIFGHIFAVQKLCALSHQPDLAGRKEHVDVCPVRAGIVEEIRSATNLKFFNVEFVNDYVIDVNTHPNPFCHPEAISWFVDGILRELLNK